MPRPVTTLVWKIVGSGPAMRATFERGPELVGAPPRERLLVALVHDEHVGDVHDAGLHELDVIAGERLEHQHRRVGQVRYLDLALADADRLDEDQVEQVPQEPRRGPRAPADAAEIALRRLRAEEDPPFADREADTDAIPEERTAGVEARRIDREHGDAHGRVALDQMEGDAADERRLAGAGRAREPDHPALRRRRGERREERGLGPARRLVLALDEGEQPRDGRLLEARRTLEQRGRRRVQRPARRWRRAALHAGRR
jgi:hypothetical protein